MELLCKTAACLTLILPKFFVELNEQSIFNLKESIFLRWRNFQGLLTVISSLLTIWEPVNSPKEPSVWIDAQKSHQSVLTLKRKTIINQHETTELRKNVIAEQETQIIYNT
mgnify:CR=1 FL=1